MRSQATTGATGVTPGRSLLAWAPAWVKRRRRIVVRDPADASRARTRRMLAASRLIVVLAALALAATALSSGIGYGLARQSDERLWAEQRASLRNAIDEFRALVTFLTQTEEMGGSIARSLRVYAETMRDKRSQAAEEAARKTVIKLIFPLVFFILPAIFIILLGPPGLGIVQMLSDPLH